ncbi:hypothetical protein FGG08_004387 [Glutinoglossum americanum]|uniref:NodB homology domain-containing protein n=1 Tax=Glutinoglossum americanum TaxID=1670608 RepID=A0A9P8L2J2_9PEZI|nr:hypothetical protein FGG08_004387 [Glutinoglossum americanum]
MSFLRLEGYHVFVTGASGGIGSQAVKEFLAQGCNVTAHDLRPSSLPPSPNLFAIKGDISSEVSIREDINDAVARFGAVNILIANAGITDESSNYPIWTLPLDLWEKTYATNVRGTFLTIKCFLAAAKRAQDNNGGKELENLAIVVTGSECGKFGQAGHGEYASGKAGLQYGLVRTVKNEMVRLNSKGRINAVAPGWVDTPLIEGRLDDPHEMWIEAQATGLALDSVPLRKIAKPEDVARTMAFLASHHAAGHISGECLSVDGGMEGRIVWPETEAAMPPPSSAIPISAPRKRKHPPIRVLLTIDFDALSGYLGTGTHPDNNLADYSAGIFAGQVGAPRLLKLFQRLKIADKVTWFIPGHSMETFPGVVREIVDSGAEIALHGYCHEGAYQLSPTQERDVLSKCIDLATKLTGKRPLGYRAPLYQLRETTIALLEEFGFLYGINPPNFALPAETWMHPTQLPTASSPTSVVEIPANWYGEDMTPLSYYPHAPNTQGYVDVRLIERMWKDRFEFLAGEIAEVAEDAEKNGKDEDEGRVFMLVLHPDTSGMAHVIGMVERFLRWVDDQGEVEFLKCAELAGWWREKEMGKRQKGESGG